jgi:hypothetical protein
VKDRDRLLRALRAAERPQRKRNIVCYDAAWAGLPPITIHSKPRKPASRRIPWARPAPKPDREWPAAQMVLPL